MRYFGRKGWGYGGLKIGFWVLEWLAQSLHFSAVRERLMMLLNATLLLKQTKYISVVRAYGTLFGPEPCLLRAKDSTS